MLEREGEPLKLGRATRTSPLDAERTGAAGFALSEQSASVQSHTYVVTAGPETRYAKSGTFHLAYQVLGQGPPDVVYVPGWTTNIDLTWDDPYLGPFARRFASLGRFITYDKRGTGMSDPVESGAVPSLEERVDDLMAVLDAAECERATLLAFADGGAIAILFAAAHPERVETLGLYACWARLRQTPDYPCGVPDEVVDSLVEMVGETWGTGSDAILHAPSVAQDPRFVEWLARYERRSASPMTAKRFLSMAVDMDIRDVLSTVHVPTVVLHRQGDLLIPSACGRYLADHIPGARYIELPGIDHLHIVGDIDTLMSHVAEMVTGRPMEPDDDRVLATIMFTDIVSSTERASEVGDHRWRDLLDAHDGLVRRQLDRYGGREVKTTGDGFLASFDGPARAIRCAQAIIEGARSLGLSIRVGIHTGECEARGDDLSGMAVHIAARVAAIAEAGETVVSSTVKDLVIGTSINFADRGTHTLKGVPGSWDLFAASP